jgi:hypothetical protein
VRTVLFALIPLALWAFPANAQDVRWDFSSSPTYPKQGKPPIAGQVSPQNAAYRWGEWVVYGGVRADYLALYDGQREVGYLRKSDGDFWWLKDGRWVPGEPPIDVPVSLLTEGGGQVPSHVPAYSSPPGRHRHVMLDGQVVEHDDSNNWKIGAHDGMQGYSMGTYNVYPKYTGPVAPTLFR